MGLPPFNYLAPKSSEELAGMLAEYGDRARVLAGGTDLINWIAEKIVTPDVVIDLNALEAVQGIHYDPGKGLRIGAAVKIEDLERSEIVKEKYFSLFQATGQIGSPQVRAMASIGGNSCNASPCADTPPPLVTFGATVNLVGKNGNRQMPLEDFIQGNRQTAIASDEFLESFLVPEPWPNSASRYETIALRAAQEIDVASVAVNAALDADSGNIADVRIALGAVAPVPKRAVNAESILKGQKPGDAIIEKAAASCSEECQPIDDLRASAAYRRHVIGVLATRVLRETIAAIG
jgi:carbon-monoxide dehydrogenase medium subunit